MSSEQHETDWLSPLVGGAIGFGVGLWAGISPLLQALVVLMIVDMITGLLAGAIAGQVSSSTAWLGSLKKGIVLGITLTISWLNMETDLSFGVTIPAAPAVTGWFCLKELISILENAHRSGIDLGPLKGVLAVAQPDPSDEGKPTRGG